MKLAGTALVLALGSFLFACAGPANGGWVTKGGWDASSRAAPAPAAQHSPSAKESLPEELLANPYATPKGPASNLQVDKSDPWDKAPSSGKAKTSPQKSDDPF